MSSQAKKNNHEVTRSYLEQWGSLDNHGVTGLHWIDLQGIPGGGQPNQNFEAFIWKKNRLRAAAEFAIKDYLYVPLVEGRRNDGLENEFATYESAMIELCRGSKESLSKLGSKRMGLAIMGCLTHAWRDAYGWLRLYEGKKLSGPILRETSSGLEANKHNCLVRNLDDLLTHYGQLVGQWNWTIFLDVPCDLLVSERPCFDMRFRAGYKDKCIGMPLSPNRMLIGTTATKHPPGAVILREDAKRLPASTWEMWNSFTVERSRQWIVGKDSAHLGSILPLLEPAKYNERVKTERTLCIVQ